MENPPGGKEPDGNGSKRGGRSELKVILQKKTKLENKKVFLTGANQVASSFTAAEKQRNRQRSSVDIDQAEGRARHSRKQLHTQVTWCDEWMR